MGQQSNPLSYLPPPLFRTDLQLLYLFSSSRDVCWLAACTRSITAQPSQYYSSPDSPPSISRTTVLADAIEDSQQRERNDGFLVENVELVADGRNGQTSTGGEDGGLGGERGAR